MSEEARGAVSGPAPKSWSEIKVWRAQIRKLLIERRLALPAQVRQEQGEQTKAHITHDIDLTPYSTLGIYWPIRGEIDVRDLARRHIEAGRTAALPVCVSPAAPLEFWRWHPGMHIRHDRAKIPIPAERDLVTPDALLIPVVGFDREIFRLGYGGGYYDRTLAAFPRRPLCIGLGYAASELPTIYPQPHDIRLDVIVTEKGVQRVRA